MGIYSILWGIIQHHLFCCSCSSSGHCSLLCSFDIALIIVGVLVLLLFGTLISLLVLRDAPPGLPCIFPAIILESATEHCFRLLAIILETKISLLIYQFLHPTLKVAPTIHILNRSSPIYMDISI